MIKARATIIGRINTADAYDENYPPETVAECEIHTSGDNAALIEFSTAAELKSAIISGQPVTITFGE